MPEMKESTVLNYDAAMTVKTMYEERDARGRRVWSHRSLAKQFNCSETTILRALNNLGSFVRLPTPMAEAEMNARAVESLKKVQEMLAKPVEAPAVERRGPNGGLLRVDPISGREIELPY